MGPHGVTSAAPAWFTDAIATTPRRFDLTVDGYRVACRAWGDAGAPAIVLVHGAAAHAGWWDHVAPLLADEHHVLALDLAGHGDSDPHPRYRLTAWRDQVAALVAAVERPLLVGHSLGGQVALLVAEDAGAALLGTLVVDTEVPDRAEEFTPPDWRPPRQHRAHPDAASLVARFRTLPRSSAPPPYVVAHVAEQSVVRRDDGWTWKFDPTFFDHDRLGLDDLGPVTGSPVRLVRGADGLVDDRMARRVAERVGHPGPPVTIAGSGHHVLLDRPRDLAMTVRAAAREWAPLRPRPTPDPHPVPKGS